MTQNFGVENQNLAIFDPFHTILIKELMMHNRRTQLLFATGIECAIDNCQVLKYQLSVTSRVIFHHFISLIIIKYWNISLDVTDGWYFRIWRVSMSPYLNVAFSNWVGPMCDYMKRKVWKHQIQNMEKWLNHQSSGQN